MFGGWFGGSKEPAEEKKDSEEGAEEANANGGGGVWGFMKGMLGMDQLKAEEGGDANNKLDIDENQRKGLFKQLSGLVGKDVTSMISLPVWIFEPVSFLQVMSEPLQYAHLLQKAANSPDPIDRIELAAAFNCALYSLAIRTRKPFNPLLGETFEIVSNGEHKFKFLAEQVSHHPPIGVSETVADDYSLQLETELKSKFYGNSSEVFIEGMNHFRINTTGDHITWPHLVTACHNIIIGSLWLDHYGDLDIKNHTTGDRCLMKFAKAGWLGAGRYGVTGEITDEKGNVRRKLRGKWNEALYGIKVENGVEVGEEYVIWSADKQIDNKFRFTQFMLDNVINLTPEYEKELPENDSRLRADRRALEVGDLDTASKKKHEMEEAQRARKREREARNEHWTPRYFERIEGESSTHEHWHFNGKYWKEREQRLSKK